jgi:hypothetical protein
LIVAASQWPVPPFAGNVFRVYRDAACHWVAGQPLYDGTGNNFLYLPQCALLCAPLSLLSFQLGGFLWRILNIAVFAIGVSRFARLASPNRFALFPLVSLIIIPLSWSAARHGQMTMMMGGLMLLAAVDLAEQRWWRAVFWMALGVALKPLMLVLVLLAAIVYPQTAWRMFPAMVALLLVPFMFQQPAYVVEQYRGSIQMLQDAKDLGMRQEFPHLFWVLKSVGMGVPPAVQTAARLAAAAFCLAICRLVKKKSDPAQAAVLIYTLAVVYLMLFNPRTEHNSYCLLTPPLALYAIRALVAGHQRLGIGLLTMAAAMLASYPLGKFMPTIWLKPVICIFFLVIVLWQFWRETWPEWPWHRLRSLASRRRTV